MTFPDRGGTGAAAFSNCGGLNRRPRRNCGGFHAEPGRDCGGFQAELGRNCGGFHAQPGRNCGGFQPGLGRNRGGPLPSPLGFHGHFAPKTSPTKHDFEEFPELVEGLRPSICSGSKKKNSKSEAQSTVKNSPPTASREATGTAKTAQKRPSAGRRLMRCSPGGHPRRGRKRRDQARQSSRCRRLRSFYEAPSRASHVQTRGKSRANWI